MWKKDFYRYAGNVGRVRVFLFLFRKSTSLNWIVRNVCKLGLLFYKEHSGLEISSGTKIGEGLYLGHAFNITINPNVVIGKNCNIHKGVTIGQENRGKRNSRDWR